MLCRGTVEAGCQAQGTRVLGSMEEGTIFFYIVYKLFFNADHFLKSSLNVLRHYFWLCFGFLAERHRGSQLPDQGPNLCWRAAS